MGSLETLVGSPFIAPQGDDVFNIREPRHNASLDLGSGIAKTCELRAFARLQPATFVDVSSPHLRRDLRASHRTCAFPRRRGTLSPWMNILYHERVYAASMRAGVRGAMIQSWVSYLCVFAAALLSPRSPSRPLRERSPGGLGRSTTPAPGGSTRAPSPAWAASPCSLASSPRSWSSTLAPSTWDGHPSSSRAPTESLRYEGIAVGFAIIFATGMLDDVFQLKPLQKLLGQFLAASVAAFSGCVIGVIVNP